MKKIKEVLEQAQCNIDMMMFAKKEIKDIMLAMLPKEEKFIRLHKLDFDKGRDSAIAEMRKRIKQS